MSETNGILKLVEMGGIFEYKQDILRGSPPYGAFVSEKLRI